jgi:predicted nucleic acid-binding protein
MNQVFIDTSGFIALEDNDDHFHAQARSFQRAALKNGWRLVTTNYVLAEAYTWIRLHLGHRQAVDLGGRPEQPHRDDCAD